MSTPSNAPAATDDAAQPPRPSPPSPPSQTLRPSRLRTLAEDILHPQADAEPTWRALPWILAVAFLLRAVVAVNGDFTVHPDEIQQYLEQAHRLVFGNGTSYWEFFYGARSWLIPGLTAGMLYLFKLVGLGDPLWYVDGIKLLYCAISLAIPAGMYFFARGHFGEAAARVALLAGALWYELIGFAHKPLTEFVATVPFMLLLAAAVRPALDKAHTMVWVALLAVLTAAIRLQYAPLALLVLALVFLRVSGRMKGHLALAAVVFLCAAGLIDAVTWNSVPFHSYFMNVMMNVDRRIDAAVFPFYQQTWWLVLASGGVAVVCIAAALRRYRHYGLLLLLIVLTLTLHAIPDHKEYRFIYVVIPLWLVLGAGLVASLKAKHILWVAPLFLTISFTGIMNELPSQHEIYRVAALNKVRVRFIRYQDPVFEAYRHLSRAPDVRGIVHVDRAYHETPGYYYLHRQVPFYDTWMHEEIIEPMLEQDDHLSRYASHIVAERIHSPPKGYRMVKKFGHVRLWQWQGEETDVREWRSYQPLVIGDVRKLDIVDLHPDPPVEPENFNIRFVDEAGFPFGKPDGEPAGSPGGESAGSPDERGGESGTEPIEGSDARP